MWLTEQFSNERTFSCVSLRDVRYPRIEYQNKATHKSKPVTFTEEISNDNCRRVARCMECKGSYSYVHKSTPVILDGASVQKEQTSFLRLSKGGQRGCIFTLYGKAISTEHREKHRGIV